MSQPERTVRTLIADDHFLVRAGVRTALRPLEELEIVYEAADAAELLEAAERLRPGLVITDLAMPGRSGLEALGELRRMLPDAKLLVVSMNDNPNQVRQAVQCGAHGYVLKGGAPTELEHAVRLLLAGRSYFSPELTQQLLAPAERRAEEVLTERQLDILKRLAAGASSKQIAFDLGLSAKTVDAHRARIMERLGIRDLANLSLYCVRQGLINPQARSPKG